MTWGTCLFRENPAICENKLTYFWRSCEPDIDLQASCKNGFEIPDKERAINIQIKPVQNHTSAEGKEETLKFVNWEECLCNKRCDKALGRLMQHYYFNYFIQWQWNKNWESFCEIYFKYLVIIYQSFIQQFVSSLYILLFPVNIVCV